MLGEKGPRRCGRHLTPRLVITCLVETNKQLITILYEANIQHPSHFLSPLFFWTSFCSEYLSKRSMKNSLLGTLRIGILLAGNNAFLGKVRMILAFARTKLQAWALPDFTPTLLQPLAFWWQVHPTHCNQEGLKCKYLYLSSGSNRAILLPP